MLHLDKAAPLRDDVNSICLIIYHHRHKPVPSLGRLNIEHWEGGYQIFYTKQVFIPKHLKLILSVPHRHQMRSVVVFPLQKLKRQLDGKM